MRLKIKEYRDELRITQTELANGINSYQRNISNWENGFTEPDCEMIVKLADYFDITIDDLFGRQNNDILIKANSELDKALFHQITSLSEPQKYALMQFLREIKNQQ